MSTSLRYRKSHGWTVRVFCRGKKWEQGGFGHGDDGEAKAQEFAAQTEAAYTSNERWEHPRPGAPISVADLVRDWHVIFGPLRSQRTQMSSDPSRVAHIATYFGARQASSLTLVDVTKFATSIMEDHSAWLAIGCLSVLRRALNLAAESNVIQCNPVPKIGQLIKELKKKTKSTRPDAWTHDEVETLLEIAARHEASLYPALRFALATGARRGEIIALRWEDVDFSRARVEIRRTTEVRGRGTKDTKTGESRFTPLARELLLVLNDHLERLRLRSGKTDWQPEWVFPSPEGLFWQEANFYRTWCRLRTRAAAAGVRPLPFHSTRHTFITWALEAGTPAKRVAEWVGCSVSVLERHYAHLMPADEHDLSFLQPVFRGGTKVGKGGTSMVQVGDPGGIRTPDFLLRRQALYPAELPGHGERAVVGRTGLEPVTSAV